MPNELRQRFLGKALVSEQGEITFAYNEFFDLLETELSTATAEARKQEHQRVIEAELTATKYHLEDMRKLVFEPTK